MKEPLNIPSGWFDENPDETGGITVGDLKRWLADVPDDALVFRADYETSSGQLRVDTAEIKEGHVLLS